MQSRRALLKSESGAALAVTILMGLVMIAVVALVARQTMSQNDRVNSDRLWEEAFQSAESGLEVAISEFRADPANVAEVTLASGTTERERVIATADDPSLTPIAVPNGEYVVFKDPASDALYAVGFGPSRDAAGRMVRIVTVDAQQVPTSAPFQPQMALLIDGKAKISGEIVLKGNAGSVHANEILELTGKIFADGCVTASDDFDGDVKDIKKTGPGCPKTEAELESQPEIDLPVMAARDLWEEAEYQMCPNGDVLAGPAHPTLGSSVDLAQDPCATGTKLGSADGTKYLNWKMRGWDDANGAEWTYESESPQDGSFYFYWGSAKVSKNPANWDVTMVTEAQGAACNKVGGDIEISGNIKSLPYGGSGVTVFADRDLGISGNKNAVGMMVAMEQLEIKGNPSIDGSMVVVEECDSPDSSIHLTEVSGNPTIRNDGSHTASQWVTDTGAPTVALSGWAEL